MKNMKVLVIVGLYAIGFCTMNVLAANPKQTSINTVMYDNHIPTGAEKISMQGKLELSANPDDIEAGATRNAVYLYFNQNFGNGSISLYNPEGQLIYSNVVDTSVQRYVTIPIANNSGNGDYYLTLDNANGFAEGDFNRNGN